MRWSTLGLVGAAGLLGATSADAAETVHLYLKAGGQDIKGDSAQTSLGRQDSIECGQLDFGVRMAGAERKYESIRCVKKIDKASPLIAKALAEGKPIDATFKFFRPSLRGDGTTEQFYTVTIKLGRVDSIRTLVPNVFDPQVANLPALEEIAFTFKTINFTFTNGGVAFEDTAPSPPTTPVPTAPIIRR